MGEIGNKFIDGSIIICKDQAIIRKDDHEAVLSNKEAKVNLNIFQSFSKKALSKVLKPVAGGLLAFI
jgi:hypothetical protein